ncbi:hypothetical protein LA03_08410 [Burkholderia gladioli]|nr:hypothetical protein LA03_08410 [Burkholderia gladioli]
MLVEVFADAGGHHVRPKLLDPLQAGLLAGGFADRLPAGRQVASVEPYRVLPLAVSHYKIQIVIHGCSPGKAM